MMSIEIQNARLPGYRGLRRLHIEQGLIQSVSSMNSVLRHGSLDDLQVLDVEGDWISLGGVDLQINGALGLAFPDLRPGDEEKLAQICQFLWSQGVDGFLPTIVTTSIENIQRSLSVITHFIQKWSEQSGARIFGVHLEGPFLNCEKCGAHPPEYLLPLTIDQVKRVIGDYASLIKIITLAPELDASGEVIPYLQSLGITVSLGHSQAKAVQAQQAFAQGATMVTHAFNAMPGLHHREPGLLGAAIAHPEVYCGLIADGEHVSPLMLDLLLRASHYEQGVFLVSDALSPLGLADGLYPWDTRQIEVKQGVARLPDGTLSGTTLSLLVGAQNLVKWGICDVEQAISLATIAPRKAIGLPVLFQGQPAHLLQWQLDITTQELTWQRLGNVA